MSLSLFTDAVCKTNINKAWRKYKTSKALKWLPKRMNKQRNLTPRCSLLRLHSEVYICFSFTFYLLFFFVFWFTNHYHQPYIASTASNWLAIKKLLILQLNYSRHIWFQGHQVVGRNIGLQSSLGSRGCSVSVTFFSNPRTESFKIPHQLARM